MKKYLAAALIAATCTAAVAMQAMWTGAMEHVQTVSFKWVWKCQYNYQGRVFWVAVSGNSCPRTVEVE